MYLRNVCFALSNYTLSDPQPNFIAQNVRSFGCSSE